MKSKMKVAAVILFTCFLACIGPGVQGRRPRIATFGTYNTALIRGIPGQAERKQLLIRTLRRRIKNRVPDVLCLQELVRRQDARDIVEGVSKQFPYHASLDDLFGEQSTERACSPQDAAVIGACLVNCLTNFPDAITNCTLTRCNHRELGIQNFCFSCFASERGAEGVDNPVTHCATNVPASEYRNAFGELLISRYPLQDIVTKDYNNDSTIRRGYVRASIPAVKHDVLCTHLSSYFAIIDHFGPDRFGSAHEQQADEVKQLMEVVEGESKLILLGDFNTGPAVPGLIWEVPTSFGLLASRGLFSVNALWCGHCTFCQDNILTGGLFPSLLVDHIFLSTNRASAVISSERLFDDITTASGLPLSDHFGVSAVLYTGRGDVSTCRSSEVLGRNVKLLDLDDIDFHVDEFCPA